MEKAFKFGQMEVSTKVTGKTTKLMVKEDLFTEMEMYMKGFGSMIKLKVLECTLI